MPTRTLSTLDYIKIAEMRLNGLSQQQIADDLDVSVSLISKIEQNNKVYKQIHKKMLDEIVAERGRQIAQNAAVQALEQERVALAEAVINTTAVQQAEKMRQLTDRFIADATNPVVIQQAEKMQELTDRFIADATNPVVIQQAEKMRQLTDRFIADAANPVVIQQAEKIRDLTDRFIADVSHPVLAQQAEKIRDLTEKSIADMYPPVVNEQAGQMRDLADRFIAAMVVQQAERINESTQRLLAEANHPVVDLLTQKVVEGAGRMIEQTPMGFLPGGVKQERRPSKEEESWASAMFNKPYKDLSRDDRRRLQLKMRGDADNLSPEELRKTLPFVTEEDE